MRRREVGEGGGFHREREAQSQEISAGVVVKGDAARWRRLRVGTPAPPRSRRVPGWTVAITRPGGSTGPAPRRRLLVEQQYLADRAGPRRALWHQAQRRTLSRAPLCRSGKWRCHGRLRPQVVQGRAYEQTEVANRSTCRCGARGDPMRQVTGDGTARLTLSQAIAYLGCSRSWFFRHVRPSVPVYRLHRAFFRQDDLDEFVRSRRIDAAGTPTSSDARRGHATRRTTRKEAAWEALAEKHCLAGPARTSRRSHIADYADGRSEVGMPPACPDPAQDVERRRDSPKCGSEEKKT